MSVPATWLAGLPLAAVLGLMIGLRWRAAYAGLAGLGLAALLAVIRFAPAAAGDPVSGPALLLGGAGVEALFATATILWIILPALALFELQSRSGALATLRAAVARVSDDRRTQVVLIAFFFGLFMEGVAGFGAPVALTAPLLVGMGFAPVRAVGLALIGHAAGVSFGALGTPVLAQTSLVALDPAQVARETALLNAAVGWLLLVALIWLSGRKPPTARDWLLTAAAAVPFYAPYVALAAWTGPELPTVGGALVGGAVFAALASGGRLQKGAAGGADVAKAALPYAIIVALVLATRLIPPIRDALLVVRLEWSLASSFGGAFQPLYHPGGLLAASFVVGGLAQGRSLAELAQALSAAIARLGPVALALVAMLALSRVMVHAGLIADLAGAAMSAAAVWPLTAPFVGVLGSFVTGSATASNILLAPFQAAAAEALGLPQVRMAAAQGFGAGLGNIVCPHNVIAGSATVGLQGREGDVLRLTAASCLVVAAAGGTVLFVTA